MKMVDVLVKKKCIILYLLALSRVNYTEDALRNQMCKQEGKEKNKAWFFIDQLSQEIKKKRWEWGTVRSYWHKVQWVLQGCSAWLTLGFNELQI